MKYIVKNCPAYSIEPTKYGNICKKWSCSKPCQKRNDCLIKKIIQATNQKQVLDLFNIEVIDDD